MTLPRSALTRLALLLLAAGCAPPVDRVPPRQPFVVDGVTYEWGLAHGRTGSLSLQRLDGTGVGYPEIIMTCAGTRRGALQVRSEAARTGSLSVSARDRTFSVASAPFALGNIPAYSGEGAFPRGWFDALARADQVSVRYGDRSISLKGPGPAAVAHYRRYCEGLDRKPR